MIDYICITPDIDQRLVQVKLGTEEKSLHIAYTIKTMEGVVVASGATDCAEFSAILSELHLWTIETPHLYTAEFTINGTSFTEWFGMRKLSTNQEDILLNNKPFFMRGYIRGTICHDHQNNCHLSLYEWYAKNISMAKAYGYNTIRFHSAIPHRECFEAADRLGMFLHIEMRKEQTEYDNLEEMVTTKDDFISLEEVSKIISTHYNHPSLMVYCVGNEIHTPAHFPQVEKIVNHTRRLDPSRLVIDTCAHGEFDREYVDFDVHHMGYTFPFGKYDRMFDTTEKLTDYGSAKDQTMKVFRRENGACGQIARHVGKDRPIIAHEVCHYTAFRDYYKLKEKFEEYGVEAPWWVDEEIKLFDAKGLRERFDRMFSATKAFQFMSWKIALEAIRRSSILNGYHMLQLSDTDKYENSNGILDCFDDETGIDREDFLRFNGDTVVLADLPVRSFFGGNVIEIPVMVSNFSQISYGDCVFTYELIEAATGTVVISDTLDGINLDGKGRIPLCRLKLQLPIREDPVKYELVLSIRSENHTISNHWGIWSYVNQPHAVDFADTSIAMKQYHVYSRYPQAIECSHFGEKLYLTDTCDDKMFEQLEAGRDVLLLYRERATRHLVDREATIGTYSFRATWDRFKPVIWDRGTNYGGLINNQDALCFVPNDGITDLQFYHLVEDSDKIVLDDFPVKVEPIFEGIDKCTRDRFDAYSFFFNLPELMPDRTLRNFGYLFELRVGKGRLLVSGLNFTGLGVDTPETCAMFESLLAYAKSDQFRPTAELSVDALRTYLRDNKKKGILCERVMTHEWQRDIDLTGLDLENICQGRSYFDVEKDYVIACEKTREI